MRVVNASWCRCGDQTGANLTDLNSVWGKKTQMVLQGAARDDAS